MRTGGGPPQDVKFDEIENVILEIKIIGSQLNATAKSPFDDDADYGIEVKLAVLLFSVINEGFGS